MRLTKTLRLSTKLARLGVLLGLLTAAAPGAARAAQASQGQAIGAAGSLQGGLIDEIIVRVNGVPILYSEFEAGWQDRLAVIASQIPQEQIDAQAHELRLSMLAALIEGLMFEQAAEQLGIVADPNEVDRAIVRVREENGLVDDNRWRQGLAQNGLTEATMREQIAVQIVRQRLMFQEITRQVFITGREAKRYYEEHLADFTEAEQVAFQQLIILAGADMEAARQKAENARRELQAGVALSAVASKYGGQVTDATEVTYMSPDDLVPEVAAVLEVLTPLSYSPLIGRPGVGYFIVQLMDRKEERVRTFEEASGDIRAVLTDRKMGDKLEEYTRSLRERAFVEVLSEEFADVESIWTEATQGAPTGTPGQRR